MNKVTRPRVPVARTRNVIAQELQDELMIYDETNHKAHCLNRTAALVWKNCDGRRTAAEVAHIVGEELSAPVDERLVWHTLRQLDRRRLFEERLQAPKELLGGMTRRELVRALGLSAVVAAPLITSLVAPTAAQAQSTVDCLPLGTNCSDGGECCENLFCCNLGQGSFCVPLDECVA